VTVARGPRLTSVLGVVVAGAVACARPADTHFAEPRVPLAPLGSAGVAPGAPDAPWSSKTPEQRMEYMGLYFHPRMRDLFQKSDPAAYDQFRCQTCHGEDMVERHYAMPASLRPLSSRDPIAEGSSRDAKATDFMVKEVLPATAKLLGEGGPAAEKRVSCTTCHAAKGDGEGTPVSP
jgi:hypothetical protein